MGILILLLVLSGLVRADLGLEVERLEARYWEQKQALLLFDEEGAWTGLLQARDLLQEMQEYLEDGRMGRARERRSRLERELEEISWRLEPHRAVETRGIWLDDVLLSQMQSREDIVQMLDWLGELNLHILYPDLYHYGLTFYPSQIAKGPDAWDPLACLIEEAHQRGFEVHGWFRIFNAGQGAPSQLLFDHPKWAQRGPEGEMASPAQTYWLDPAHPQVREYLFSIIQEVVQTYAIDGIHLDYIRSEGAPLVYGEASTQIFRAFTGYLPWEISSGSQLGSDWQEMQAWFVTSFLHRVSQLARSQGLLVSAAVFSQYPMAQWVHQYWSRWAQAGIVDLLMPMTYFDSLGDFQASMASATRQTHGLPTHWGLGAHIASPEILLRQIQAVRESAGLGMTIFSGVNLSPKQHQALAIGPFRNPAYPTHRDPRGAVRVLMQGWAQRLLDAGAILDLLSVWEELDVSEQSEAVRGLRVLDLPDSIKSEVELALRLLDH